ncbi:MAG: hypothetical protein ABI655_13605 [Phenylobacterium sp.]
MQLFTIPPWINVAVAASVLSLVLWKGGWRERLLAATLMVTFLGSYGVQAVGLYAGRQPWRIPGWYGLGGDLVVLAICLTVALSSGRYWTIWASSLALLILVTHLLRPFATGVTMWAYQSAQLVWLYLLLAVLLGGAWQGSRS